MKTNHYKKIILCKLVFLCLNFTFSLQAQVNFTDSNFEKLIREKVEWGWIWVPNYTGENYQFLEEDFSNVYYLSFDSDDDKISSLVDLQWFPNLQTLHIWDASNIDDFSPIWGLSDQLQDLAINRSTESKLSGVSVMNKLVSLDLEHNNLTSLSFLGSHPDLTNLYLSVNYLDLSDPDITGAITSFSTQIQETRNLLGWWWYADTVEFEPQYPASFKNLDSETSRIQQILSSTPSDAEANLLRGIYKLFNIIESTDASGLKEFAVSVGVDPAIRNFVLSDLSVLENYDVDLQTSFQMGELAELFQNSIIPDLEEIDQYFANITSSNVIILQPNITGSEGTVTVDYADVLVLRTMTNLLAGLASLQSGYDWDMNAGQMDELDDSGDMNVEQIRAHNPNFAGIRSTAQLAKAKVFFQAAIDLYQLASPYLTDYNRLGFDDRLFALSINDLEDEADFRSALLELESSFAGPFSFEEGGDRIDLSRLFAGEVDLANLLPENKNDKFTTDQISDPTFGGLFPDWTQRRVSDEIEEAELLWDERAIVFWRWESIKDDPYSANSWSKQSVVLRYLGDDSEEVLFSVNTKGLVSELGLDTTMNSNLWLEESKVCVSPDRTRLIFGYALTDSTAGMSENRYLVRIISYDMLTRSSSIVREWIGSEISGSIGADYVDFCIDALVVDWSEGKIYFSEEILSSEGASAQVDYIKLVSCGFDGQNLTAVKRFERLESGMSSLEPTISMIHLSNSDLLTIRISLEYSDSMGSSSMYEIHTIDSNGNQLVVPIENESRGSGVASSESLDSFNTFSLSEDDSEIYFITYDQDLYSTSVKEPSITRITNQGYDKETVVDLSNLTYRTDIWDYWSSFRKPEVVMMSEIEETKIIFGVEYLGGQGMSPFTAAEILEVNLSTGGYKVLTTGKLEYDWALGMNTAYDDFSTFSIFYPDGAVQPPQTNTDSDGDGLPDDIEIAAGMNPNSSDKIVIDAVYSYFFSQGEGAVKSLQQAKPHTYNWYFQPEIGWMWTDHSTFPYIFKSTTDGQSGSWMYFSEQSANPIQMYDYNLESWLNLGE